MTAVPNYGGRDGQGATGFNITGDGAIPTPRQIVAKLDEYVIGQDQAKKVKHDGSPPCCMHAELHLQACINTQHSESHA